MIGAVAIIMFKEQLELEQKLPNLMKNSHAKIIQAKIMMNFCTKESDNE